MKKCTEKFIKYVIKHGLFICPYFCSRKYIKAANLVGSLIPRKETTIFNLASIFVHIFSAFLNTFMWPRKYRIVCCLKPRYFSVTLILLSLVRLGDLYYLCVHIYYITGCLHFGGIKKKRKRGKKRTENNPAL